MPFQQALSSIFLPSTSIYASIDHDDSTSNRVIYSSHPDEDDAPDARSVPHGQRHTHAVAASVDPFSADTPSAASPLPLPPPSLLARHDDDDDDDDDDRGEPDNDPFHDDLDRDRARSQTLAKASTPTSSTTARSAVIGSKSLMGLLGGTTYRGRDAFAPDGQRLDDDEDIESIPSDGGLEGDQATHARSRRHLLDSALRESLPDSPPPRVSPARRLSGTLANGHEGQQEDNDARLEGRPEDEDEEEDEVPPDFTSRIPLLSSQLRSSSAAGTTPNRKRKPRVLHPHSPSTTSSSRSRSRSRSSNPSNGGILGHAPPSRPRPVLSMSARERALWRWVNVDDLDRFLDEVYRYYVGKGVWTIGLERILNLLTVGWVIGFSTFLIGCVDYPKLWHADKLSDAVVSRCVSRLSGFTFLFFVLFVGFYAWRVAEFGLELKKLWEMHEFYTELLEVPEDDIQTIPWPSIVDRLARLRASHPSSLSSRQQARDEPLDAHSVANRIMRSQNYLVALLNAPSVLDFSLPLPNIGIVRRFIGRDGRFGQGWLTKALEWNLNWTVLGFVFDERGAVREMVLSERKRNELISALQNRFILVGLLNALFAPFIVVYLLIYSFFRYFEEYHKNPSTLSSRQFTPLAIYRFRSFNELDHEFSLRLSTIRPLANLYLSSYPRAKTALVSRFVAFLAGSFAAVLIAFSIIDPDAFLHFEVTPGRTVLFWIGILGGVVAVARGMTPAQDGEAVRARLEPGEIMKEIVDLSRYCPEEWEDRLHAYSVHQSFAPLFPPKPLLFLQELSSVLLTPLILLFTLPKCAGDIVDFFREFTIEVEGLGRVFDLKGDGARRPSTVGAVPSNVADDRRNRQTSAPSVTARLRHMENKMEKSLLNFAVSNPDWQPRDEAQSLFLSQMLSEHPPPSTIHLPHQQHSTASHLTSNFRSPPPSRSHSQARNVLHPRFSVLTPAAEPPPDPTSLALRHRRAAEKAKLYDRAFQRSTLLASSTLPGRGGRERNARNELGTGHGRIEEESKLDGESFVAPTEELPFGFMGSLEEEGAVGTDTRTLPNNNLGRLVGELYRR
ncbi:hypothetical protein JCM11491_001284 [Sporobolomyces phaffii]